MSRISFAAGFSHQNDSRPDARTVFVLGWTGMRGVLALAAALSLPQTIANGSPFPHRDLIVFLTFSVILVTLLLQGLTLAPLIRVLGLAQTPVPRQEDQQGRRLVLEAALAHIEELRRAESAGNVELYDDLQRHYQHRVASLGGPAQEWDARLGEHYFQHLDLSRALLDVERRTALRLRNEGQLIDEVLREIEHELDLNEARLIASLESSHLYIPSRALCDVRPTVCRLLTS